VWIETHLKVCSVEGKSPGSRARWRGR
jgi:hypothetical protein